MDWKYFKHDSPGTELISKEEDADCYYDYVPAFIEENGYLPIECRNCYKGLIFWTFSRSNVAKFRKMLKTLPVSIHGKYDENVVVFYFRDKDKMLNFLDILQKEMSGFKVEGRIQWRVSGRYWQNAYPHFFESAKALKPIGVKKEISIKNWLTKKGLTAEPRERMERADMPEGGISVSEKDELAKEFDKILAYTPRQCPFCGGTDITNRMLVAPNLKATDPGFGVIFYCIPCNRRFESDGRTIRELKS